MKKYQEYIKAFGTNNEEVSYWIDHNLNNYLKTNPENQDDIEHILDYFMSDDAPKRLRPMSYTEAKINAEKWQKIQQKKGASIEEKPDDTETILDFNDGFRIVKLIGENAYKREGFLMSHCVASYYGNGKEIYSLRDKDNMPHCTIEKDNQVKGKGNGNIHPKYIEYVIKFLEKVGMTVGDNEMKHLGYINVSKIKKYLHKDTKFFNINYVPDDEKLIGNDGNEFASLDILDVKPLVKEIRDNELKINFHLPAFIEASIKFIQKNKKILSGNSSKLASSGDYSQLASSGDSSQLASSGNSSQLASSGDYSKLASSGNSSQLASSGYGSQLEINGEKSVGANIGINGIIKGKKGNWITLAEYNSSGEPICVISTKIDGKIIKEDTWYILKNGKFVINKD
jgi:hypothetical protein